MIQRAFRYRLYPTPAQAAAMQRQADAVRFVYNLALEQRRTFWRQAKARGITFNYVSQGREITALRREVDWLAEVGSTPLYQCLRDLDRAYAAYFRGGGEPRFRAKDRCNSAAMLYQTYPGVRKCWKKGLLRNLPTQSTRQ